MTNHDGRRLSELVGSSIDDRYRIEKVLGEGNFGIVYLATQLFLGTPTRRVALKLCKREGLTPTTARELFGDAFLLAESLDAIDDAAARGHLVQVFDVGICADLGDRGYLAMEYVPGTTLAAQFRRHDRVAANQLLKWLRQACRALAALHELEPAVVHRDLKPDNLLLGTDLAVRVVDFGLSARLLTAGYVSGTAGTVKYMAPETILGKSVPASDVYSMGLVLYEGLTGSLPFERLSPPPEVPEVAHSQWIYEAKRTFAIAPPSARNNTVTAELDRVVLRCLAFDARDRFAHAGELLGALDDSILQPKGWEKSQTAASEHVASGDPQQARLALEQELARKSAPSEARYHLLVDLAELHANSGDHADAAGRFKEAWELVEDTAILETREARSLLLGRVAESYDRAGNPYFAKRFRDRAAAEGGPNSNSSWLS